MSATDCGRRRAINMTQASVRSTSQGVFASRRCTALRIDARTAPGSRTIAQPTASTLLQTPTIAQPTASTLLQTPTQASLQAHVIESRFVARRPGLIVSDPDPEGVRTMTGR